MARPITWRNVEAPDLRGAASMLQLANNGFNSGFDKLNQVLQNEQATAESNWKVQRDNNTQAFLNSINQYRTPEEYQAALASGALTTDKYGAQIDQAAARSALDGRLSILQDRAVKAGQFEDQQKAREAKPIVDHLKMMMLSKDKDVQASAEAALPMYMSGGYLPNGADLAKDIRSTGRQNTEWEQADTRFQNEQALQPGKLQAQEDAHLNAVVSRRLQQEQINSYKAEPAVKAAKAQEKQTEEQLKIFHSDNAYGNKNFSTDPAKNVGIIAESIKGVLGKTGSDAARKITQYVAENPYATVEDSSGNKVQLPLNSSVVTRAIHLVDSGKKDSMNPFMRSEGYGDDYVAAVKNKIQELVSSGAKDGRADSMLNSYATLQQLTANQLRGAVVNAPAQTAGTSSSTAAPGKVEQAAPASVTTALERAAEATKKPESPGQPSVDSQTILAQVTAKDPKARAFWVNGERYKYQSVTDSDNQVTGSAWVRDGNTTGIFSSGVSQARTKNGYTGEDSGVDIKTTPTTTAAFKESLKNSGGVTNAPADQPKVSAPMAGNVGQAKVPVVASLGVAYTDAGVPTPVDSPAPSKAAIKSLSSQPEVVSTYAGSIPKGEATKVRVTVGDGDTFKFQPSDPNQKVPNAVGNVCRFDVIDAPEVAHPAYGKSGQPSGEEAAAYLRNLMDNKEVSIKVFGQDKRNDNGPARNICQVEIEGKAIDLEMVKAGFAHVFDGYINKSNPRYGDLKQAEESARTRKIGMFNNGYAKPGWEFRAEERKLGR